MYVCRVSINNKSVGSIVIVKTSDKLNVKSIPSDSTALITELVTDGGSYGAGSSWIYGDQTFAFEFGYTYETGKVMGFGAFDSGNVTSAFNANTITVHNNVLASANSDNIDKIATFVATRNSTISSGVTNSVVLGGEGITAITSNTVHVPSLEINGEVREFGTSTLQGAGTLTISGGVSIVLIKITGAEFGSFSNNVTLPNGNIGQKITIYVVSNSGVNTTIGGSFLGYNTVKLTEIGESVQLLYSDDGWVIIGGNNFVAVA